jgi:hypothetical protein
MGMEEPSDIDRAAIEEHAQRTTEQTALRKMRNKLDRIEADEANERHALRYVLVVCALLAVLGLWFFSDLLFGDRGMPKPPPMQIPAKAQPGQ